ncbi:MAG: hypothetical protein P8X74_05800 [Reinekea sp.]|jgi:hypothetical protein
MFKTMAFFLCWLAGSALAAGNVLLVTDLNDDNLGFRPDLRLIATGAINRLRDFEVASAKTSARPNTPEAIAGMIKAAGDAQLSTVAVATLYNKRRKATMTVSMYNVASGELTLQRALEFRFKEMPALLSRLEYELPLMLKREFRELGIAVKVTSDQVYFDLGTNAGIEVGQIFRVFRRGEEIKNSHGESYGFVDQQSGIIEVVEVSSVYAVGEIHLGRLSIRNNDWVELGEPDLAVRGQVLSKLDEQVAINIGRRAGVTPGSYFAIYKDIKDIDSDDAFREMIGRIRITQVDRDTAFGEIARSDHYRLAKALINEGDYIDEVTYHHRNQFLIGQTSFGISGTSTSKAVLGINLGTGINTNLSFRARSAFGDHWFASGGFNSALNNSESFSYGLDILYTKDGFGTYMFTDANLPTPFSKYMRFAIEAGYLIGADKNIEGASVGLSAKFGLDSFF